MLILCDVDSTVADMLPEWLNRYNKEYEDTLTQERITAWDMTKFVKKECGENIYKYLNDPTLYDDVKPYDGALFCINEMRKSGHRVVFLTAGVPGAWPKLKWLKHWGLLPVLDSTDSDFICAYDKSLIHGDLLIDDRDKNVITFADGIGRHAILLDRPWNLNATLEPHRKIKRANSWQKVCNLMRMWELGYRD